MVALWDQQHPEQPLSTGRPPGAGPSTACLPLKSVLKNCEHFVEVKTKGSACKAFPMESLLGAQEMGWASTGTCPFTL